MHEHLAKLIIGVFKEEAVNLVVTLPEEPTANLSELIRQDPFFSFVSVSNEGHGLALAAGASLGGRGSVFITGVAGLMVGTWALGHLSLIYGIPLPILVSYRGDVGDKTGIPGGSLLMFKKVAEPLMQVLGVPYVMAEEQRTLGRVIRDAIGSAREYNTPIVVFLRGEVLW